MRTTPGSAATMSSSTTASAGIGASCSGTPSATRSSSSEADSPTRSVASESRKPGAYAATRSSGSLMLRTLHAPLREPEPAEVDSRIAGAPALEEPADRRVQDDAVELVASEEAMPTHRCVLRGNSLERAVELPGEDDVHDVLLPHRQLGRDRVDDCHRPLEER